MGWILFHMQYWLCPQGGNKVLYLYSQLVKNDLLFKSFLECSLDSMLIYVSWLFKVFSLITKSSSYLAFMMQAKIDTPVCGPCGSGSSIN